MQIVGVDHVTVRVRPDQVEAMRAFYEDVLGLQTGPRALRFPGVWLYLNGQAVVHVAGNLDADAPPGTDGGFDHFALRTRGLAEAKARLDRAGIPWREVWRPELAILQIVLHDPAGVKVELTFDPAEHDGIAPARSPGAIPPAQARSCSTP